MNRAPLSWGGVRRPRPLVAALGVAVVLVVAGLWLATLLHAPGDSGSLDARVSAVGATVRCPICKEPIPLDDVQNVEAGQMRTFIRHELRGGASEDVVRQELVARYGPSILLAPRQQGFDALAWLVPLFAVAACAVALLLTVGRWTSGGDDAAGVTTTATPIPSPRSPDAHRYEALLDQELARRE